MTDKPWLQSNLSERAQIVDMMAQIEQLKLKEVKLNFLLANMPKMCVHYDHHMTQLPDGRVDVKLTIRRIHDLEKDSGIRHVRVDVESFDEQLAIYMKESGK